MPDGGLAQAREPAAQGHHEPPSIRRVQLPGVLEAGVEFEVVVETAGDGGVTGLVYEFADRTETVSSPGRDRERFVLKLRTEKPGRYPLRVTAVDKRGARGTPFRTLVIARDPGGREDREVGRQGAESDSLPESMPEE